jgi:membrane associated rhomboid family serine protease
MIFPIGHEHETVRRLPWVSIAIIALNLLAFVFVALPAGRHEEVVHLKAIEVLTYWQQHPYLDISDEFVKATLGAADQERVKIATEAYKNMHPGAADESHVLEQRKLDALVQSYFAARTDSAFISWGLVPAHPRAGAFLTSMFMHSGWLHLLGNMFMFYLAGLIVEDAFGRPLFALLYLASGLVAAVVHVGIFPHSTVPLVGASGAIAGVMGAFLVRFFRTRLRFAYLFWVIVILRGTFTAPAWLMLPLWLLQQLLYASLVGAEGGVAYWAHVGGFVFGAAFAYAVWALRIEERFVAPQIEAEISITQDPALEAGLACLASGDSLGARRALAPLLAREPRNADANLAMWESYVRDETPAKGAANMAHVVEHELRSGELALAFDHWRELVNNAGPHGPAPLAFRLATALQPTDSAAAVEILAGIADDPAAGLLAGKAMHRLASSATSAEQRAYWARRAAAAPSAEAPALPAPAMRAGSTATPRPQGPPPPAAARPPAVPGAAAAAPSGVPSAGAPPAPGRDELSVEPCILETLDTDGMMVRGAGGATEFLPYSRIASVAVGGITGVAKPYLVLDLVLLPMAGVRTVLRIASTHLDPRMLTGRGDLSPVEAFRELVRRIATSASASTLSGAHAGGAPKLPTFNSLQEYEQAVLSIASMG